MRVLITGGAGFIGSHMTRHFVRLGHQVCVADRFTYAGKGKNLADVLEHVSLLIGDLATGDLAQRCAEWHPDWVIHMAAETHVDHAIEHPERFVRSNVLGTTRLLQAFWYDGHAMLKVKKLVCYSTDEVFGSTPPGVAFDEQTPFNPSNAYSASKVGIEGIANSFAVTHRMPIIVVRPCNTYGPGQHPEKVIPKFVGQMLRGEPVTVYNDGKGARDWLHAEDHARGIEALLVSGQAGESYNLGANEEHNDLDIARRIQSTLIGEMILNAGYIGATSFDSMIKLTPGRPGHDKRYMMDNRKILKLGWKPQVSFETGFRDTVLWNAEHRDWWQNDEVRYGATY